MLLPSSAGHLSDMLTNALQLPFGSLAAPLQAAQMARHAARLADPPGVSELVPHIFHNGVSGFLPAVFYPLCTDLSFLLPLRIIDLLIRFTGIHQLFMRPHPNHNTIVQYQNQIRFFHRADPLGNNKRSSSF